MKALHREAALRAALDGLTLNEFIKAAIEHQIEHEKRDSA